jgi:two-component system phosphate regulon sensor histidine kinase PhoR
MILSFIGLVLLTAVAIGAPAIWLIRDQLELQAWSQVEQGRRAALALYEAREQEIKSLAILTAQRPTLRQLLSAKDTAKLQTYLQTLREGTRLDLLLVCDTQALPATQTDASLANELCRVDITDGLKVIDTDGILSAWMISAQTVDDLSSGETSADSEAFIAKNSYHVVVGIRMDDSFAQQMRDQTGLDHTVLVNGKSVGSSLSNGNGRYGTLQQINSPNDGSEDLFTFSYAGTPYYATRVDLSGSEIKAELSLSVSGIVATQRRLAWAFVVGILGVALVSSTVGAYLARRIAQPLANLTEAAAALSTGDLATPIIAETRVREVALVAQALANAQADLKQTLEQLRQEKAWTDHLLEAIVEGIVTLDEDGRITFFSQGAQRITGWQRDQVLGRPCNQVFQPLETDNAFTELIPPPDRRSKIPVALQNGREAILAVTGARLLPPGGGNARIALVFRDVSEEEAVHRLLGHFLVNVAHEFRTPLAAVAASVELLLDQAPELSSSELNELLNSLHLGVLGLQTLVDNLLEGASIEAGHFRVFPRPADLSEIIAEAIHIIQPLLHKRGQFLTIELPAAIPIVQADPRRIVQVFVNLLSNASRYGPDEAEIGIAATVKDADIRIEISDQGPGVLPEQRKDLFRRFRHAGSTDDTMSKGAGLGLSVVKAIVEAHGGQVGMDARSTGGSIFWFTLPRGSDR